jgi:hypothetical protein
MVPVGILRFSSFSSPTDDTVPISRRTDDRGAPPDFRTT